MAVNQFERNSRPVRPRRVGSYDPLRGMSPGQSMAMAGNTGLAGLNERDVYKLQAGTERAGNKMSFADLGRAANEMGSKYRRPVQVNKSFFGDDSGRQVTPSMLNSQGNFMPFTATLPNFSPLFGDASRAFTGYNSLKYPATGPMPKGQNQNTMFMQNTPGMMSGVMDYVTGGGTLGKIISGAKNLYDRGMSGAKNMFDTGIGVFRGESQFAPNLPQQNNSVLGLTPLQQVVYNRIINIPGKTHQEAYAAAIRQNYPTGLAMGGIASLN